MDAEGIGGVVHANEEGGPAWTAVRAAHAHLASQHGGQRDTGGGTPAPVPSPASPAPSPEPEPAPSPAPPAPEPEPEPVRPLLWAGGFEPGDLSEWGLCAGGGSRPRSDRDIACRAGHLRAAAVRRCGLVVWQHGDQPRPDQRAAIHQEGEEDYTRVSLRVPSGFPVGTASNDFQVAYQWHGAPHTGSPPISIDMTKDRSQWQLGHSPFEPDGDVNQPQSYRAPIRLPLTKYVWHHFIYRVKWSRFSAVGFFEVWHAEGNQEPVKLTVQTGPGAGGQRVLGPTLNSSMTRGVRPIAANYRRQETTKQDGTIFYDGVAVGDSFSSVRP